MDKEKELFEKIQTEIKEATKSLAADARKGLVDADTFKARMDEINQKHDDLKANFAEKAITDDIQSQIENLNEKLEAMKLTRKEAETFVDAAIKEATPLLQAFKEKGHAVQKEISIKSAPTAVSLGLTTTTGAGVVESDRETGIQYSPKRAPLMLDVILSGTTNSNSVSWVEKTDEAGAPTFRKEFETFAKRSWKTIVRTALVKKIAVYSEHSKEILEDLDGFQAELRRDLVEQIQLELDKNILRGTGGGADDADHKGILEYAQAWSNGTFTVANPTLYDVLAVAVNQIRKEHHNPTVILMNSTTQMRMKLTKDKNENYVLPPFSAANGVNVEGLPVITNNLFNDNEVLVMDGSRAQFMWKRNWTLEVTNSHSDNFVKDVITVSLTGRGVLKVKNIDVKAFVHIADVNDAITALTPSS